MNFKQKLSVATIAICCFGSFDSLAFSGYAGRTYASFNSGIVKREQSFSSSFNPVSGALTGSSKKSKLNALVDISYGYHLTDDFRIDVSGTVSRTKFKYSYIVSNATTGNTTTQLLDGSTADLNSKQIAGIQLQRLNVFSNIYYDLPVSGRFIPYLGLGIGLVNNDLKYKAKDVQLSFPNSNKKFFGYQMTMGANFHIGHHWDTTLALKYLSYKTKKKRQITTQIGTIAVDSGLSKMTIVSKLSRDVSFMIGLRKTF